jgi:hypothetical protein
VRHAAWLVLGLLAAGCAKEPPKQAPGRVGCITFVAPAKWTATLLDDRTVHGWILTSPEPIMPGSMYHHEFRIFAARTALRSPRDAVNATLTRWETEASGDGGVWAELGASTPRLDSLEIDGVPALLMESSRSREVDGQVADTRRHLLTLIHDGVHYTAAVAYEVPRDAPDPLAPLAKAFIHSVRVKCE